MSSVDDRRNAFPIAEKVEKGWKWKVEFWNVVCRLCDSFYRVTCIHVDAEKSLLLAGLSNGHVALYNLERCTQITECYRRIRMVALLLLINSFKHTNIFSFWHGTGFIPFANFEMVPSLTQYSKSSSLICLRNPSIYTKFETSGVFILFYK